MSGAESSRSEILWRQSEKRFVVTKRAGSPRTACVSSLVSNASVLPESRKYLDGSHTLTGQLRSVKSLGILCENFIALFLVWRNTISLEQAARKVSHEHLDESKIKTKVRRLYDIANVLAAIRLIKKTNLDDRKPAFKWVGESGLDSFINEMSAGSLDQERSSWPHDIPDSSLIYSGKIKALPKLEEESEPVSEAQS
jgi:hypothetical protein